MQKKNKNSKQVPLPGDGTQVERQPVSETNGYGESKAPEEEYRGAGLRTPGEPESSTPSVDPRLSTTPVEESGDQGGTKLDESQAYD